MIEGHAVFQRQFLYIRKVFLLAVSYNVAMETSQTRSAMWFTSVSRWTLKKCIHGMFVLYEEATYFTVTGMPVPKINVRKLGDTK